MSRDVPYSIEAEESLLGAALIRPMIVHELIATIDASDFYRPQHQVVWSALMQLHDLGQPIDTITVHEATNKGIDIAELNAYQNATPSVSAFSHYADIVIAKSRRRRMIAHFSTMAERCYSDDDIDEILRDSDAAADRLIAPRTAEIRDLHEIGAFMARAARDADERPWLVPGLMKALWRIIVVAPEGFGKAVLMRFLALHAAAGRDPWQPSAFIDPRKVLYVDVENGEGSISHQIRISNTQYGLDLVAEAKDNLFIWHREGGIDLRKRRTSAEFEAVLQRVRPEIVFAGPLYKLYRRGPREDMEMAALDFTEIIDDLRMRYGFCLMLEHHAPKASGGGYREMNPFGSSLWSRWPEFGITMEPQGHVDPTETRYDMEIGRFRRDREVADWPNKLTRGAIGQVTAWRPTWYDGRGEALK